MATGTIVYNKDQQQIYPISDGSVIISNASGSKSNVEEDLKKLFKQVSDLSGSSEAVNNIIIKIHYLPADTAEESEIKLSTKQWTDTIELPTEENPYIWKRTKFTFQGADESQGTTIYEIVASDVSTICTGMAASMGAVLLVAGTRGKRFALQHSRVMIHQPMGGAQGQASDIEITAREIQKLKKELYTIIADHSGNTYERVEKDSDRDYWMTAAEAKEYGMIDDVLTKAK